MTNEYVALVLTTPCELLKFLKANPVLALAAKVTLVPAAKVP